MCVCVCVCYLDTFTRPLSQLRCRLIGNTTGFDVTKMGGSTGTIAAGVAVGVIVALVLLVCAICLAVVVLRRRLRKEPALAITENEETSYPNAVYEGLGMLLIQLLSTLLSSSEVRSLILNVFFLYYVECDVYNKYDYCGTGPRVFNETEKSHEVHKIICPHLIFLVSVLIYAHQLRAAEAESIYQEPGRDECTLYAQLEEIVTDVVTRDTVL